MRFFLHTCPELLKMIEVIRQIINLQKTVPFCFCVDNYCLMKLSIELQETVFSKEKKETLAGHSFENYHL